MALVGVGSAATRAHLPALADFARAGRVEVVAVCDRDPARREAARMTHPGARGFSDNAEMLEATRPEMLVIATPPSAHLDELAAAVSRSVDVVCEKPLGLSTGDVAALEELARRRPGVLLATVHQYRYASAWRWIARAAGGAVAAGEPFHLEVRVERPGTDPLSAGGWRADPEHEGGILGDHASHYLALLRLLDPGCSVLSCQRQGPGGRETSSLQLRVASGVAEVHASYAGAQRSNLVRLERPAQCLEVTWRDDAFIVIHDGRAGLARAVPSLSDRGEVNALYTPMYREILDRHRELAWRDAATEATLGTARLLADAIALAAA